MQTLLMSCLLLAASPCEEAGLSRFQAAQICMGTSFKIVLYAPDAAAANQAFRAAFGRIRQLDRIMSDYDPQSELRRLCDGSPTTSPVPVSEDLCRVLHAARQLSERTEGAFDVTVGPLTKLWRRARRHKRLPRDDRLAEARQSVGYQHLLVDPQRRTVQLRRPKMRLDLGGIAKGYAADQALATLRRLGITRALVNGGGDISVGDSPPGRNGWKIAIAPLRRGASPNRLVRIANAAIATSGDAWQFVEINGTRYSHILDPRTGRPLTGRLSVTVVAADGAAADSLASAVSVLGPEQGLPLIEQTAGAAALIVRVEQGVVRTYTSSRFPQLSPTPANDAPGAGDRSSTRKQPQAIHAPGEQPDESSTTI